MNQQLLDEIGKCDFITLNNKVVSEIKYCSCGVPKELHGTGCGWGNANCYIYPMNDLQKEWKQKWENAHPYFVMTTQSSEALRAQPLVETLQYVIKVIDSLSSKEHSIHSIQANLSYVKENIQRAMDKYNEVNKDL